MPRLGIITATCIIALVASAGASYAHTGDQSNSTTQIDFWGFSIAPDPVSPGDLLEIVGVVNAGTSALPVPMDFANNEYTVHFTARLDEVIPNGPLAEYHFNAARVTVYEDPSFNAPFQATTDPDLVPDLDPSDVPGNFRDGTSFLEFRYLDFITLWFAPSELGSIAYTASELRLGGGSAYQALRDQFLVVGWHNGGGYTASSSAFIPEGYGMRWDPLIRWESPLPVQPATWGSIKNTFK